MSVGQPYSQAGDFKVAPFETAKLARRRKERHQLTRPRGRASSSPGKGGAHSAHPSSRLTRLAVPRPAVSGNNLGIEGKPRLEQRFLTSSLSAVPSELGHLGTVIFAVLDSG